MVQKARKEKPKWYVSRPPILIALALLVGSVVWALNWEPQSKELSQGELKSIVSAEDPGLTFTSVIVGKTEIRGEMITTDPVTKATKASSGKEEEKAAEGKKNQITNKIPFRTPIILGADMELLEKLNEAAGTAVKAEESPSPFGSVLLYILFLGVLSVGAILFFRWFVLGNSPFSFGRSRHNLYAQKDNKVTFKDAAGIDEAVAELREIVDFLKTPEKYQALGGRIPKGVLLVGPPGTGKTLLAKAVAGEADVPFFSLSGSDFVEMFVGVGASRVRDLFGQAESEAPCIIFIDELDALGKTRSGSVVGGHDEREQTLNQLLVEMDGFETNRGVIIMAATNRPEMLDAALLRPGRFDRTVVVDRPDIVGREAILKVHVRSVKLADDVDLHHVAALTPGSVGADLANLVNEAALMAARNSKDAVTMADFDEAIERGTVGLERKSRIMQAEEKQRVAYHEAGHALVACALPNTHPVHKVSIIPRGVGALGYVLRRPEEDRYLMTQTELESHIKVALGGTLAEELIFKEISNGATSDLDNANQIARSMVTQFGMSDLGRVSYRETGSTFLPGLSGFEEKGYSEETAREIDLEVRKIIEMAMQEVRDILRDRRNALEALAHRLVEKEVIAGPELKELLTELVPGPKLVPSSDAIQPSAPDAPSDEADAAAKSSSQAKDVEV